MPRLRPIVCRISLISFRLFRPKFFVLSISASVFCTSSRIVRMFAFLRQLYDRTDSSSSSTHLSRFSLLDAGARLIGRRLGLLLGAFLEVDEDVQVIADQLRRQRHRVARADRPVGPDVDRQLVVVGRLAEARRLDEVVDLLDRRVHRVDRNPADAEVLVEVLVGRDVAAAALHAHLHVELAALGDGGDVRVRLEDLDVAVGLDVARPHFAGLVDADRQRLGVVDVQLQRNLLEVEDDVGRVLDHAGDRRELVQHAVDLDGGDRRAFDRGQQHAPQRVADGRAEAALERLRVEPAEPIGQRLALELQPLGSLKTFPEHRCMSFRLTGPQTGLQTCK